MQHDVLFQGVSPYPIPRFHYSNSEFVTLDVLSIPEWKIEAEGKENPYLFHSFTFGHPNSSQDQIAHALQIDKATIAKALTSLEKKGYIQRASNPENRRKNIINITALGRETTSNVVGVYDSWMSKISDALTPSEWSQFEEYCMRILVSARTLNQQVLE